MHHEQMKIVEVVLFDEEVDNCPKNCLQIRCCRYLGQKIGQCDSGRLDVAPSESDEKRVFVGEVLIERSDRDIGPIGDVIGRRIGVAVLMENVSSCVEDSLDRASRALLAG